MYIYLCNINWLINLGFLGFIIGSLKRKKSRCDPDEDGLQDERDDEYHAVCSSDRGDPFGDATAEATAPWPSMAHHDFHWFPLISIDFH